MLSIIKTSTSLHSVRQRAEKEERKPPTTRPQPGPDVLIKKGGPRPDEPKK